MHAITEPCPNCGSLEVRAAFVRVRDVIGLFMLRRPLYCIDCGDRFWVRRNSKPVAGEAATAGRRDLIVRIRRPSRWVRALLLLISDPGGSPLE
jgi:hypothetical protein